MSEDYLADDFNRSTGARRMCGGMPSQVMGPQMDADQLTGLVNHCPGSLVGQRKNALIRANSFLRADIGDGYRDVLNY